MPLRNADDFLRGGSKVFRRAPTNKQAIQGWVQIAKGKVADADRAENSPSTRFGAAYDAVLNLSFAVLSAQGWRASSEPGHHAETLEAACAYARVGQGAFDSIDAVREVRRNQYGGAPPADEDVKRAIAAMERLVPELLALLGDYLKQGLPDGQA